MEEKRYWYARGYFDGRSEGEQSPPEYLSEQDKQAYISGYIRGVTDFCIIDMEEDE